MKFYTKKFVSITSSLLIAAQQCSIAFPVVASDVPSEAERYSSQIGLELNNGVAEEELSDLININGSDLSVVVDDNNNVTQIDGLLSDVNVDDSTDAKDIIAKVSELLGIDNITREIRLDDVSEGEYNRIYTFKQFYQGLEMENSYVTVVVDKETREAEYLNSSVVSDFSINTIPTITAQQAIDAIYAKFGESYVSSYKLAIYSEDNETFRLVWKINTNNIGNDYLYVDAVNGEIIDDKVDTATAYNDNRIYYNSVIMDWNNKILPDSAYYFDVDIAKEGNQFLLQDMNRKLYLISSPSFYAYYANGGLYSIKTANKKYTIKTTDSSLTSKNDQYSVAVLYNLEKTYDFYKNKFGYNGFDGNGSEMYVIPTMPLANSDGSNKRRFNNAASSGNVIYFGEGDGTTRQHYGSDINIVAHEFTHSVTGSKVKWGGSTGETGSLNEAYSDIMGEYVDPTREWQTGTDHYIKNTGKNTSNAKTYCIRDLRNKQPYVSAAETKRLGNHGGSVTISNVAHWMDKLGIDANTAAKIWFTSLDYLPKGSNAATFKDCRTAVIKAASKVITTSSKRAIAIRKIKTAFNRVHIYDSNELLGDLYNDGRLDSIDLVVLKRAVLGTKTLTRTEEAQADLNFDGKVDSKDVVLLTDYLLGRIKQF